MKLFIYYYIRRYRYISILLFLNWQYFSLCFYKNYRCINYNNGIIRKLFVTSSGNSDNTVIIIGGTGSLGTALTSSIANMGSSKLYVSYRNKEKAMDLLKSIKSSKYYIVPQLFELNLDESNYNDNYDPFSYISSIPGLGRCYKGNKIVINNIGVCIEGNTLEIIKKTIFINTVLPISVMNYVVNCNNNENISNNSISVINISSGDGERVYINTNILKRIDSIKSIQELIQYISELITNYKQDYEYAYGISPIYSLSKCLLNKANILFQQQQQQQQLNKNTNKIKFISVCPGNFISSMSTTEELEDAIRPEEAAQYIIDIIVNNNKYKSGQFYRFGEEINY